MCCRNFTVTEKNTMVIRLLIYFTILLLSCKRTESVFEKCTISVSKEELSELNSIHPHLINLIGTNLGYTDRQIVFEINIKADRHILKKGDHILKVDQCTAGEDDNLWFDENTTEEQKKDETKIGKFMFLSYFPEKLEGRIKFVIVSRDLKILRYDTEKKTWSVIAEDTEALKLSGK